MKTTKLTISLFLIAFFFLSSCKENSNTSNPCCEELEELKKEIQDKKTNKNVDQNQDFERIDFAAPSFDQEIIDVGSANRASLLRYRIANDRAKNYFDISDDILTFEIPITIDAIEVESILNISSSNKNAILVYLKAKNTNSTPNQPVKKLIKINAKISKIRGLKPSRLVQDGKLKVVILYNDILHPSQIVSSFTCIANMDTYTSEDCPFPTDGEKILDFIDFIKPKENGGGVISGGN